MESLVPIIIAIAFFALQAIASSNKKKEAARRQLQKRELSPVYAPRPAASQPKSPFEQLLEAMREQGAIGNIEEEEIEEPIVETPDEPEQKFYPAYQRVALEEKPLPAASNFAPAKATITATTDEEEDNAFVEKQKKERRFFTEPFDAGMAIVYSEIMRPKFAD
jgi:hypothetical protein